MLLHPLFCRPANFQICSLFKVFFLLYKCLLLNFNLHNTFILQVSFSLIIFQIPDKGALFLLEEVAPSEVASHFTQIFTDRRNCHLNFQLSNFEQMYQQYLVIKNIKQISLLTKCAPGKPSKAKNVIFVEFPFFFLSRMCCSLF